MPIAQNKVTWIGQDNRMVASYYKAVPDRLRGAAALPGEFRLERVQLIPRPRAQVFAFFAEAANLERLTPPFLRFRILTPAPIIMGVGTLIDYQLRLYGIPIRWRTRIETFVPGESFTDVQLAGPYRQWIHRHDFIDVSAGTEMRDTVDYALPFGPVGRVARRLFVRASLDRIFAYRAATVSAIFP